MTETQLIERLIFLDRVGIFFLDLEHCWAWSWIREHNLAWTPMWNVLLERAYATL